MTTSSTPPHRFIHWADTQHQQWVPLLVPKGIVMYRHLHLSAAIFPSDFDQPGKVDRSTRRGETSDAITMAAVRATIGGLRA